MFSIVTVAKDNLLGLKRTHESIAGQSCTEFEWIVIDGASNDGTVEFLARLTQPRPRFQSEPDAGIFDGMNKGLALARNRFVLFLNAGDELADKRVLSDVAAVADSNEPDLIYGDAFEREGGKLLYKPARDHGGNRYALFTHHQSIFYRTSLAKKVGYDLSYPLSADWVFTARFLDASGKTARLGRPICVFERGGTSQNPKHALRYRREHWRILRSEFGLPLWRATALWSAKNGVNAFRRRFPAIYDRLRYQGRSSGAAASRP